jgi:hypothetical protein
LIVCFIFSEYLFHCFTLNLCLSLAVSFISFTKKWLGLFFNPAYQSVFSDLTIESIIIQLLRGI